MISSLISTLLQLISEPFAAFASWFLSLVNLNVSDFLSYFPAAETLYYVFQAVAMGLAIGLGAFQLVKFTSGMVNGTTETPFTVIGRVILAIGLIYFGNYILEFIIELFKTPYNEIIGEDFTNTFYDKLANFTDSIVNFTSPENAADRFAGMWDAISAPPKLLIALILLIIFAFNMLELLMEVVERYILLCTIVFTSPLAFSTVSTGTTSNIFRSWTRMFIGQCILILFNGWSIQMLISIIYSEGSSFLLKFLLAIGFIKIAKRMDTYMQMLGISVGTTGGGIMKDIAATATVIRMAAGSKGGSSGTVLGQNGASQILTGARPALGNAKNAFNATTINAEGAKASFTDKISAASHAAIHNIAPGSLGNPVIGANGAVIGLDNKATRAGLTLNHTASGSNYVAGDKQAVSQFMTDYMSSNPVIPASVANLIGNTIKTQHLPDAAMKSDIPVSDRNITVPTVNNFSGQGLISYASEISSPISSSFARNFNTATYNFSNGLVTGPQLSEVTTGNNMVKGFFAPDDMHLYSFDINRSGGDGYLAYTDKNNQQAYIKFEATEIKPGLNSQMTKPPVNINNSFKMKPDAGKREKHSK